MELLLLAAEAAEVVEGRDWLPIASEWAVAFMAILGALGLLWKILSRVIEMHQVITYELRPNSGNSLRDRVLKNGESIDKLIHALDAHLKDTTAHPCRHDAHAP